MIIFRMTLFLNNIKRNTIKITYYALITRVTFLTHYRLLYDCLMQFYIKENTTKFLSLTVLFFNFYISYNL